MTLWTHALSPGIIAGMNAMEGISRGAMRREDLVSSSQALESSLDVSLTQQKAPGDGPYQRKDLETWKLEQREPRQGHLFCKVPDGCTRPGR